MSAHEPDSMQIDTGRLRREWHDRAAEAVPISLRQVSFRSGDLPALHDCHGNVARWIEENPSCQAMRGWLITSGAVFDKHSLVR
jgi:hypothetical protein